MGAPNGTGISRYFVTFYLALWARKDWRQREPTEKGEGGTSAASSWLMVAAEIFLEAREEMEMMERSNSYTPVLEVTRKSVRSPAARSVGSGSTVKVEQEWMEEIS
jgi:hypothetical protein